METAFAQFSESDKEFDAMRDSERAVPPSPAEEAREPDRQPPVPDPAPAAEPEPEPAPREEPPKHHVPLATFLEEQKERKRLEKLHSEDNIRQARIEERLRILNERMAPRVPVEQAPDKASDPVGYLEYQNKIAIAAATRSNEQAERLSQRLQQFETNQMVGAQVGQVEKAFAEQNPDYWDAVAFAQTVRLGQYKLVMSEEEAYAAVNNDIQAWVNACLRAGKNPAEATYELAKNYGYAAKPAAVADPEAPQQVRNADGTFGKVVSPKVAAAKESLKTVARGTEQKSLAAAAGGTPSVELTTDELLQMSDEDFDKHTSGKNWKKFWA